MKIAALIDKGLKCPKCGMKMITRHESVSGDYPHPYYYWWCGCGFILEGGVDISEGQRAREEWKAINNIEEDIMFPYYEELKKQLKEQYPHKQKREEV